MSRFEKARSVLTAIVPATAYGGGVDHSLRLAALASAAVSGLDPISVQEVLTDEDDLFDVAFIQDTQQRRWVIRAPRTDVAAAHMDASLALLALLVRRVPFAVPAAKGFAAMPAIGRAAVHSYIPGHPLDLSALDAQHRLTAELGRTIATIHNTDRALFDEAGLASYDAESYRKRHVAEVDRGAATGRVPASLLARWEEALDDVRLWRFAPTPIHGGLDGDAVLISFPDPTDPGRATVRGVVAWENAKVADPADDFAALISAARPDVVEAVHKAYGHARVERPDEHLLARARLISELTLLGTLLRAVARRDEVVVESTTARLRRLDDTVHSDPYARRLRIVPGPAVAEEPAVASPPAAMTHRSRDSSGLSWSSGAAASSEASGADTSSSADPDLDRTDVIAGTARTDDADSAPAQPPPAADDGGSTEAFEVSFEDHEDDSAPATHDPGTTADPPKTDADAQDNDAAPERGATPDTGEVKG
ncbi:MAG: phosphotransferase [Actinomycetia bacterium]|nr:phosphotransferase [Actinomycetes bacterium]